MNDGGNLSRSARNLALLIHETVRQAQLTKPGTKFNERHPWNR